MLGAAQHHTIRLAMHGGSWGRPAWRGRRGSADPLSNTGTSRRSSRSGFGRQARKRGAAGTNLGTVWGECCTGWTRSWTTRCVVHGRCVGQRRGDAACRVRQQVVDTSFSKQYSPMRIARLAVYRKAGSTAKGREGRGHGRTEQKRPAIARGVPQVVVTQCGLFRPGCMQASKQQTGTASFAL